MNKHIWAAAFAGAGLAACGGGSGDGDAGSGASAQSDVSAINYTTLAAPVARTVLAMGSNLTATLAAPLGEPGRAQAAGAPATGSTASAGWLPWLLHRATAPGTAGRARAQAVYTETDACPYGGSMTISANDADNDEDISRGDSMDIQLSNCVAESGLPALNGRMNLKLNSISFDRNDELTALDADTTFTAFRVSGYGSLTGSARVRFDETTAGSRIRIDYDRLQATDIAQSVVVYDFEVDSLNANGINTFGLSGRIELNGQAYLIQSSSSFRATGNAAPDTGSLRVTDGAGDALRLTARSTTAVDLEFYPAGATAATHTTALQPWAAYMQP